MNRILLEEGLTPEILELLSCESRLGISLKRTLSHVDRQEMSSELLRVEEWYDENQLLAEVNLEYRIKTLQSGLNKFDRHYPNGVLYNVFNDLLGFRVLTDDYTDIIDLSSDPLYRVVDMRNGKRYDDGYRGVHLYYQKSKQHYPIEIQVNTYFDRQFNDWTHDHLYKRPEISTHIGVAMRHEYEEGHIRTESDFKEVLKNVLSGSQKDV